MQWGHYEQDNDISNSNEPIEWIVLTNNGKMATLISRYGLDAKPYNTEKAETTWESCSLRKWLNGDFLNIAFSEEEQAKLTAVSVTADSNPHFSTDPGRDTQDKVFLLSVDEVKRYFTSIEARVCMATEAAVANGVRTNNSGTCSWWLRTPGNYASCATNLGSGGSVHSDGINVCDGHTAVRPVIVLRLS